MIKGSLEDTDYENYKAQLEELEKQINEKERVIEILLLKIVQLF